MRKDFLKKVYSEMATSMYRMNAGQSNYYVFTQVGKTWEGAYTYSPMKRYGFEHCMDLNTGELVK